MIDMLFWDVNLSSFDNFGRKKNLGSNGLSLPIRGSSCSLSLEDLRLVFLKKVVLKKKRVCNLLRFTFFFVRYSGISAYYL